MPNLDSCIRGISNKSQLRPNRNSADITLFPFDGNRPRPDGWIEESINWNDDANAVDFTFNQLDETSASVKFQEGIAILPLTELDRLKRQFGIPFPFDYERSPITGKNKYHGNLLLHKDNSKTLKVTIRAQLAWICQIHLRQNHQNVKFGLWTFIRSLFKFKKNAKKITPEENYGQSTIF